MICEIVLCYTHINVGFSHTKNHTTAFNSHHIDALEKLKIEDLSGSLVTSSSLLSFGAL